MPLTTEALNVAADAIAGEAALLSLHTSDPGATGANEVVGGGYARIAITWDPATGGIAAVDGTPLIFSGPPLTPATHGGLWTAGGATFLGGQPIAGSQAFNSTGDYHITQARVPATAT